MNEQEKQLLIQDLCAREPYHPKICVFNQGYEGFQDGEFDTTLWLHHIDAFRFDRIEILPYLRPLSSMTEEEREYMEELSQFKCTPDKATAKIDFYLKHHFDFRNLIEKGLAIAVTPDNNPYKLK